MRRLNGKYEPFPLVRDGMEGCKEKRESVESNGIFSDDIPTTCPFKVNEQKTINNPIMTAFMLVR